MWIDVCLWGVGGRDSRIGGSCSLCSFTQVSSPGCCLPSLTSLAPHPFYKPPFPEPRLDWVPSTCGQQGCRRFTGFSAGSDKATKDRQRDTGLPPRQQERPVHLTLNSGRPGAQRCSYLEAGLYYDHVFTGQTELRTLPESMWLML